MERQFEERTLSYDLAIEVPANMDMVSKVWIVNELQNGSIQLIWKGLVNAGASPIASIEASANAKDWSPYPSEYAATIGLVDDDNQIWEFKEFTAKYIRLKYLHGGVSAGLLWVIGTGRSIGKWQGR